MANFYISDLHIGHENILRFDNRPFADVNEMNNKLIENWNARVHSNDTVYILGDFIWAKESEWPSIVGSLGGNKVLIRGNHDPKQFSAATKRMFQEITDLKEIKDSGKHVVMCHYPIPFFRASFASTAFMLYGHVHQTIEYTYVFSPYKLIWNGDYYYVVGFSEKHKGIGSFRVDRIVRCPKILDDDAVQPPKNFDMNVYLNSMFRMYNGQRKQIELVCSNDVMDAIIDKFGKEVTVLANDMQSFRAIVNTAVGRVFYSWVFGFAGKVTIKSPEDVKKSYAIMVKQAAQALIE